MISIDTNVLVRLFINDQDARGKKQCAVARTLLEKEKTTYVSQVVQLESVWVFKRAYTLKKNEITNILNVLYENVAFTLENEELFFQALTLFKNNSTDFSDCLIHASSSSNNQMPIYTFDRNFSKLKGVKNLA